MPFDQHAFISYAHIDNEPLSPAQRGWVSRFHATLQALLSMRIGAPARIWRDDSLHGNEIFPDEILGQFKRTALLISVLTPRYMASTWCTRELKAFCEQAELAGGLRVNNQARVFKVIKTPLNDESQLPAVMRDMLGYAFFVVEDGAPLELDAAYGEQFLQDYNRRVCKLAWDAAQLLRQLDALPAMPAASAAPTLTTAANAAAGSARRLTVYLAEASNDGQAARERILAELVGHGHSVLPDQRLPLDDEDLCAQQIRQCLARADLSIHLVGRSPGAVPDGARGEGLVALQNRLAAERSATHGLARLIWLPDEIQSVHVAHQAFITALRTDAALQRGADLLSAGIDSFVQALHATLDRLTRPAPPPPPPPPPQRVDATIDETSAAAAATRADGALSLFLLCTAADRKPSLPLRRWLRDQGVDVSLPAFEGSAAEVRASNRQLLSGCDAALVYYASGDEAWKRSVDSDIRKQRGLAERELPLGLATYLDAPSSSDKDDLLEMQAPNLLDGRKGLDADVIAGLVVLLVTLRAGLGTG